MKRLFYTYFRSFAIVLVCAIWWIEIIERMGGNGSLGWLGNHPRHVKEWYTIFTGALVHGDWMHLINNTYPLLILGFFILLLFERFSWRVFLSTYVLSGLLIWLFARGNVYHVGASGVVYSWAAFLAASGFLRKERLSLALGLVVAFLYGGMIWGVLPIQEGVSWDGHLFGAVSGLLLAYAFKGVNKKKREITRDDLQDGYEFEKYRYGDFEYLKKKQSSESNDL